MLAAALLLLGACANPFAGQGKSPLVTVPTPSPTPTPSPSPTPTAPLAVSAPSFKVGEVAAVYPTAAFTAGGGVQPYQWTVSGGKLPDGLNLGADGSLNGTPTTAGTYKFTVQVADAGTSTATASGSILIRPAISASYIPACATTCDVEVGCVTVCGGFGTVGGGVGPYSYSLISGTLPPGTTLAANALTLKGTFNGPPQFLQFTAMVTDGFGETASLSPTFRVFPHISLNGGTMTCSVSCDGSGTYASPPQSFPFAGGVGTPSVNITGWTYTPGTPCTPSPCPPPTKPSVSISGANVVVSVPGPGPYYPAGYKGVLTLTVTDQSPCSAGVKCSATATVNITMG